MRPVFGQVHHSTDESLQGGLMTFLPVMTAESEEPESEEPKLDVPAVAETLNVSDRTVRRLAEQRLISHHRVGGQLRFAPSDVEAFLRRTRIAAM